MNINNNFVGSRMNKSLDERLIGPGDYIDALNIRISSDEDGEAGSVENSKGNIELARLRYLGEDLPAFSTKCIGVFEDGTNANRDGGLDEKLPNDEWTLEGAGPQWCCDGSETQSMKM